MAQSRTRYEEVQEDIFCPHCSAPNPRKAYCCISCFKVIRSDTYEAYWKTQLKKNRFFLVGSILVCVVLVLIMKNLFYRVEQHLTSIQENTEQHRRQTAQLKNTVFDTLKEKRWVDNVVE